MTGLVAWRKGDLVGRVGDCTGAGVGVLTRAAVAAAVGAGGDRTDALVIGDGRVGLRAAARRRGVLVPFSCPALPSALEALDLMGDGETAAAGALLTVRGCSGEFELLD